MTSLIAINVPAVPVDGCLSPSVHAYNELLLWSDAGSVMGMAVVGFGLMGIAVLLLVMEAASGD